MLHDTITRRFAALRESFQNRPSTGAIKRKMREGHNQNNPAREDICLKPEDRTLLRRWYEAWHRKILSGRARVIIFVTVRFFVSRSCAITLTSLPISACSFQSATSVKSILPLCLNCSNTMHLWSSEILPFFCCCASILHRSTFFSGWVCMAWMSMREYFPSSRSSQKPFC